MSSDYPLLDWGEKATVGQILASTDEQGENLVRVSKRIGRHVLDFCKLALSQGGMFHSEELREYVSSRITVAPGSVDRILRELRKKCAVNYEVLSRSKSLYRVTEVR